MKSFSFLIMLTMLGAGQVFAGSLDPPGAPGPTMKTLNQVEARTPISQGDIPLVISEPGSYYLTEDISHDGDGDGIQISAVNVTVDLNGFTLSGPGQNSGFVANGIRVSGILVRNFKIMNGTVRDWPGTGITGGSQGTVMHVAAMNNGGNGIRIETGIISHCIATSNTEVGIGMLPGGPPTGLPGYIINCISTRNDADGFRAYGAITVKDNVANFNEDNGFNGTNGCRLEGNNAVQNGVGYAASSRCIVIGNVANDNTVDYNLAASAVRGPIINHNAGGEIVTTNPWANFRY